jgi:peptide/nickel transport system ATP-binding protein
MALRGRRHVQALAEMGARRPQVTESLSRLSQPVASIENLTIETAPAGLAVLKEVTLSVRRGEILGLVGETGCGKTTLGLSLLGYVRPGLRHSAGRVLVEGRDLLSIGDRALRDLRGVVVSYVPQDPATSLNPGLRLAQQLEELLRVHGVRSRGQRQRRMSDLLGEVGLPREPRFLQRYPHQLSGGQQQRIAIAMAFACRPALVVMDEPTTGLDVATQALVLETVQSMRNQEGSAVVFVSHDLALVSGFVDRLAVMYAGEIVEAGPMRLLAADPRHPYTIGLLESVPDPEGARALTGIPGRSPGLRERSGGCQFAPRCPHVLPRCRSTDPQLVSVAGRAARCLRAAELPSLRSRRTALRESTAMSAGSAAILHVEQLSARYGELQVLHEVTFGIRAGSSLAIVGESGSGKTTLARCLSGLHPDFTGKILYQSETLAAQARDRRQVIRRSIQQIFQNPYGSLNPRKTIGSLISQPIRFFFRSSRRSAREQAALLLERVGLEADYLDRYPHELSGGERQRVAIARALAAQPKLLICDEVTSSLDVSVQATIVNLLRDLQREQQMAMLFITHNLSLVPNIAEDVLVLYEGRVVEAGPVSQVVNRPTAVYTRTLLSTLGPDA